MVVFVLEKEEKVWMEQQQEVEGRVVFVGAVDLSWAENLRMVELLDSLGDPRAVKVDFPVVKEDLQAL